MPAGWSLAGFVSRRALADYGLAGRCPANGTDGGRGILDPAPMVIKWDVRTRRIGVASAGDRSGDAARADAGTGGALLG